MKKKIIIDVLMFILFILEFSKVYMSPFLHELFGIILFVLFIIHIIFNKKYLKNIFKGKYNIKRIIILIINSLFIISFLLTMILGVLSSQEILKIFNIDNITIVHFHKTISYSCLLLMAIHLGINMKMPFSKVINKYDLISLLIIFLGLYSFIKVDYFNHLIGKYGFSVVNGNIIVNVLEYLSIVIIITILTNKIFKKKRREKNER